MKKGLPGQTPSRQTASLAAPSERLQGSNRDHQKAFKLN
jgi:hypothetical protein